MGELWLAAQVYRGVLLVAHVYRELLLVAHVYRELLLRFTGSCGWLLNTSQLNIDPDITGDHGCLFCNTHVPTPKEKFRLTKILKDHEINVAGKKLDPNQSHINHLEIYY